MVSERCSWPRLARLGLGTFNKGSNQKKKAEQKVKTAFRVGGYLTCFTFLKHFNKVKKFQRGGNKDPFSVAIAT